ncbi:hypothetical protein ACJROX_01365 [Pseudalkalibacillus sp. A8]|uniref:hypothetical protein n=1 Tax=Pseudalkalibacillus sp. A8 TaxID=3382641 RepID=UPI0038B5F7DA
MNVLQPLLPVKFDENEIYTITITMIVFILFIYLHKRPKQLMTSEVILFYFINWFIGSVVESILAEPPLDLYDTVDKPHAELMDIILQGWTYPLRF